MSFYGDDAAVPPLAFCSTIKDMKALLHNASTRDNLLLSDRALNIASELTVL
jgi:hypothetical protein